MDAAELAVALEQSRARTRLVADDLRGEREWGPRFTIVNPPRWELGHVGWFHEYWCLRRIATGRHAPDRSAPILPGADALYNSAQVAHATRWSLPLPDFDATLAYRDEVLGRVQERLRSGADEDDLYFAGLSVRHEDMHAEAFHYTRQTLGYDAPRLVSARRFAGSRIEGDAEIAGGRFLLGASPGAAWAFDNEKWAHPATVAPFRMARTAVNCAQFRDFVEAGGYVRREWWSDAGWNTLIETGRDAPLYWRRAGAGWQLRRFDRWIPLPEDEPVLHVSAHEAEAYCRFAGRRLPTEEEWEFAACCEPDSLRKRRYPWGDEPWTPERARLEADGPASVHDHPLGDSPWGVRQMIGNGWEWTSTTFLPYPGFERDPYKEYSEPWFGTHRVLRGGAFTTSPRIATSTYRNFFRPERADVFAGFRTCAL